MVENFFAKFTLLTEEDLDHIFYKFHCNSLLHSEVMNTFIHRRLQQLQYSVQQVYNK